MTKNYRHIQHAGLGWWFTVAVLVALALAVEAWFNGMVLMLVTAVLIAPIAGPPLVILSRLTVEVDDNALRAFFGWGWPRKTVSLAEARSGSSRSQLLVVRLRDLVGFTRHSVDRLDAVEVELNSGRVLRIGTDEPEVLLAAATCWPPATGREHNPSHSPSPR